MTSDSKVTRSIARRISADARTTLEQQRGQEIVARGALAREFEPHYEPPPISISSEERRRRDEYRKRQSQWKNLYEG